MSSDLKLLRQYVEQNSENAFGELVREHLKLVYSAALRESNGDSALAEDLSQLVFTKLSRKARILLKHPCLAGWLYVTVRHLAANERRADQRRKHREGEAHVMKEALTESSAEQTWQQIRPVLDDALHELTEGDRVAVVLRFLEDRSFHDIGQNLGLQENAARMRVERALEKLRGLLARRGITSTASGLAAALAIGVITPAPAALAATIAGAALTGGVAAGSTTLTAIKLMSATKLSVIGALVVAGIAVPAWQQTRLERVKSENSQFQARQTEIGGQETELATLRGEVERLRKAETDQAELQQLRKWKAQTQPELMRLRGMAGVARRANADAEVLRAELARQSAAAAANQGSGVMADAMKFTMQQQMEGRLSRMTSSLSLTPGQTQAAREILTRQAQAMSTGMQQAFSGNYNKDELTRLGKEAGNADEQIKALLTPDQEDAYQSYQKEEVAHNASLLANSELLQLQTTLGLTSDQQDRAFAALYEVSINQLSGSAKPASGGQLEAMQSLLEQKANALQPILTPAQLDSYRQQLAVQSKLMKDVWAKMGTTGASK